MRARSSCRNACSIVMQMPYAGRELRGIVRATSLRGQLIYQDGGFIGAPRGELLAVS